MASVAQPNQFELLPPELWPGIFTHLKPKQLLSIRLVCHRWKAIVDRERSFWDRIRIKVEEVTLDENFAPSVAPASNVNLEMVKIVTVDSWWPTLGERLTSILMRICTVSLETFLGMLRETPNLTQLELHFMKFTSVEKPEVLDFRLEKMQSLRLIGYSDDMLDLYGQLFPHLHELSLEDDEDHDQATARLIESVQDTLERLELWMTPYVLHKMSLMERLQLKSITLGTLQDDDFALSLSRLQPGLEVLKLTIEQNSNLCKIGKNLPVLKQLVVSLVEDVSLSFLATMPLLEILNIGGAPEPLTFDSFKCPNLTELTLDRVEVVTSSLRSYLAGSGCIKKLELHGACLDSWSELLAILTEHSTLRHLDLWFAMVENASIPIDSPQLQTNLEYLHINGVTSFSNEMLLQLTQISPRLTTLELLSMELVDDATVRKLGGQLPRLKRLTLSRCSPTVACAGDIVDRCPTLEYLRIDNCAPLCERIRKLLTARGRFVKIWCE